MNILHKDGMKIPAGITVEAAYVMAIVIAALSILIQAAYGQCRKTAGAMKLHYAEEQLRYQEEQQSCTLPYGQVSRSSNQVEGYMHINTWEKEITVKIYEPEQILRKTAILEWADEKKKE